MGDRSTNDDRNNRHGDRFEVIRVARRPRFVVVDRRAVRDDRLSFRARGALIWMLDQPDGSPVTRQALADAGPEGEKAMRTVLAELRDNGYLVRERRRDAGGHIVTDTVLYEVPPEAGIGPPVPEAGLDIPPEAGDGPPEGVPTAGVPNPPTPHDPPSLGAIRGGATYPDEFEAMWKVFPRKVEKGPAYKSWRARVMDAKRAKIRRERRIAALHQAAVNYAAAVHGREAEHIKHAATFFGPSEPWKDYVHGNPEAEVEDDGLSETDRLNLARRRIAVAEGRLSAS